PLPVTIVPEIPGPLKEPFCTSTAPRVNPSATFMCIRGPRVTRISRAGSNRMSGDPVNCELPGFDFFRDERGHGQMRQGPLLVRFEQHGCPRPGEGIIRCPVARAEPAGDPTGGV